MDASPTRIGRFEIRSPIGRGGMGTLYLAWDPQLERNVAIKVLNQDDERLRARFLREARSAARLQHPHIITVFDVGRHEGRPFIAMEYVDGFTLDIVVREGREVAVEEKLRWMEELCEGLAVAHAAGIVHRDVKPANLIIDPSGSLQILDFGIARVLQASDLTQADAVMGTLNYMSPEQLSGEEIDHRTDIHAVGAVLYELVTYRQAFPGSMADGVLGDIVGAPPVPAASLVPGLDPEIVAIVQRALRKDPGERYPDAASMGLALARVRSRLTSAPERGLPGSAPLAEHESPSTASAATSPTVSVSATPPTMVATAIMSGSAGEAAPARPTGAPAASRSQEPPTSGPAGDERGGSWRPLALVALAVVAVGAVAAGAFEIVSRSAPDGPSPARPDVEMQTEAPASPPATAVVDSPGRPVAASVDSTPTPDPDTISGDPGPEATRPVDEGPTPSDTTTPPPARGPLPARCGLLLQRLSLGEELTEDERDFLARECRRGGGNR